VADSPKKIVIIDDDKNTLAVLEAILRRRGFEPHVAPTAAPDRKRKAALSAG